MRLREREGIVDNEPARNPPAIIDSLFEGFLASEKLGLEIISRPTVIFLEEIISYWEADGNEN